VISGLRLVQSAFEGDDTARGKGLAHPCAVEGDALVDQAGDAPVSGQIDKDGFPLSLECRQSRCSEGLVSEPVLRRSRRHSCAGCRKRRGKRHCCEKPGRCEAGAEGAAERRGEPRAAIDPGGKADQHEPE
jgi:hypothetical protein